MGETQDKQSK